MPPAKADWSSKWLTKTKPRRSKRRPRLRPKLLKLLPLVKQLFGPYKAKLEAEGRDDLLKA